MIVMGIKELSPSPLGMQIPFTGILNLKQKTNKRASHFANPIVGRMRLNHPWKVAFGVGVSRQSFICLQARSDGFLKGADKSNQSSYGEKASGYDAECSSTNLIACVFPL